MGPLETRTNAKLKGYGGGVDPQRAAQSGARSTMANLRDGKLAGVTNRGELKGVGLRRARNKAIREMREADAAKRGPRHPAELDDPEKPVQIAARDLSPEDRLFAIEFMKSLSPEEQKVLTWRNMGFENREIAGMLGVSLRTVNGLVKSLKERAGELIARR
jgi:DNA-directed RNA polymerase specialized sigma24 family protein